MSKFQPDDECIGQQGIGHRHHGMAGTVLGTCIVKSYVDGEEIVMRREHWVTVMWADHSTVVVEQSQIRALRIEDRIPFVIAADDVLRKFRRR